MNGHLNNLRTTIGLRVMASKQSICRYTFICGIVVIFFNMLVIDIRPAFTQSTISEVNSFLGKIIEINKKLDNIDLKSETSIGTINKLESEVALVEKSQQAILKNNPAAKLKSPEKEQLQTGLDNLKDEILTAKVKTKMLLQIAPYLHSLKSSIDKPVQNQEKEVRILPTILLLLAIVGIFLTPVTLSFGVFLWYRNESKKQNMFDELYLLLKQIDKKIVTQPSLKTDNFKKRIPVEESNRETFRVDSEIKSPEKSIVGIKEQQPSEPQQKETPLQLFCRLYNAEVDGFNNEFMQQYKPIRIGVANAMDRRRNTDISPIFVTATDGDYYAAEGERDRQFMVVPRPGMAFQESSYGPGAMGLVFDCPNYNPQLRYYRVKVIKPAFFEPDFTMQRWKLIENGKLDLGKGE